jgi:hypothetical protein
MDFIQTRAIVEQPQILPHRFAQRQDDRIGREWILDSDIPLDALDA